MKKYNVVFSIGYEVEAEDEKDAEDTAEKILSDDFGDCESIWDFLGSNIEEVKL